MFQVGVVHFDVQGIHWTHAAMREDKTSADVDRKNARSLSILLSVRQHGALSISTIGWRKI